MARYFVNKKPQAGGEHEIHREGCTYMPEENNKMFLGSFSNCYEAVEEAKKFYISVDGCFYCSNACHRR